LLDGITDDGQRAAAAGDSRAELAQEIYAYRVRKYIGGYLAALGRADAVVFTGGVGENGVDMRRRIIDGLEGLGMIFDAERNAACTGEEGEISTPESPVKLLVIPTNEELLIARDTYALLAGG
jgi:acetate kinase